MAEGVPLQVPEFLIPGLEYVLELSGKDFKQCADALASYTGVAGPQLQTYLVKKLDWTDNDAGTVARLVISADRLRDSRGWTVEEAAAEIARATNSPADSDSARELLVTRLSKMLNSPGVALSARTTEAVFANDRTLAGSRLFTELRPVFDEEENELNAVGLVHTLQIAYIGGDGRSGSFFVTLDDDDLVQLDENVDRARRRGLLLRNKFTTLGVPVAPELDGDEQDASNGGTE